MPDHPTDPKTSPRNHRVNARRGRFGPGNPGKPFQPGNPGKPEGARRKATTALAAMLAAEAEAIGRRAIELAQEGRVGAVKLVLDRAFPARHGRCVEGLRLPSIATAVDAVTAMGAIMAAVSAGTITTDEARDLSTLVENFRKIHELADIERRVAALESHASAKRAATTEG